MSIPSGYQQTQVPRMSPEQMDLFKRLLGQSGQYGTGAFDLLGKFALGDDSAYQAMEKPALDTFNQQLLPGIAHQFAQGGALNSSSFRNAASGAAGNLANSLGAQRSQIQQTAIDRLLGYQNQLLGMQQDEYGLQKKKGWWDYFLDFNAAINNSAQTAAQFMGGGGHGGGVPRPPA